MPVPEPPKAKALNKNDLAILKTGRAAKAFVESEFGKFYFELLRKSLEEKRLEYEKPVEVASELDGVSQVLRAESAKGAIMGIRLALEIPNGMITSMEAVRREKSLGPSGEDE